MGLGSLYGAMLCSRSLGSPMLKPFGLHELGKVDSSIIVEDSGRWEVEAGAEGVRLWDSGVDGISDS